AWAPHVLFAPDRVRPGGSYVVGGFLFNGMSQGSAYGDDVQGATNYPLVRITNDATGHVFYSRTHDHSSMGLGPFVGLVHTHFDVPASQEKGSSKLVVVANGIPSEPVDVFVR
ncbi:MAG: repeat domain protein, partial [Gammaproteobacteria bacterium]|nr:repeat domain protein [Gammaproteobacteria bacterium]